MGLCHPCEARWSLVLLASALNSCDYCTNLKRESTVGKINQSHFLSEVVENKEISKIEFPKSQVYCV